MYQGHYSKVCTVQLCFFSSLLSHFLRCIFKKFLYSVFVNLMFCILIMYKLYVCTYIMHSLYSMFPCVPATKPDGFIANVYRKSTQQSLYSSNILPSPSNYNVIKHTLHVHYVLYVLYVCTLQTMYSIMYIASSFC